jgi:ADP-ribosylglycohydrolase
MAHDPLSAYDLVHDEMAQRHETGYDMDDARRRLAATDPGDDAALVDLYRDVTHAPRTSSWPYREPDDLNEILAAIPAGGPANASTAGPDHHLTEAALADRVLGGWLGRIAGCNLGKPVEDGDHWTAAHLKDYLVRAGAYPLRDYIPVLDPMPTKFVLRENWPQTTRGNVNGSDRDDDIDFSILALHLLERHGSGLAPGHVASAWLRLLPFLQVFTAERAAYRNLVNGVPLADVARTRNPYREWIGAQIRADAFGWVNPGNPRAAAVLAYQDASLSHVGNGIYGEMWAAALVASAFTADGPRDALLTSLSYVPPDSRLAEALREVLRLHGDGVTWEQALIHIQNRYGHYSWVHTVNNAAAVSAGLLWGEGDYTTTVGLTVQAGWDTDSNGATAGSVSGVLVGAAALPDHFIAPLDDRTRSALFGFDHARISELAARTSRLAGSGLT